MIKIGVFDSGIGGKSVALAIEKSLQEVEVLHASDPENLPYGTKTKEELRKLALPKIQGLLDRGIDVLVIACNTISTNIIEDVRSLTAIPIITTIPLIEEASAKSSSKIITVCATPATLSSSVYKDLKEKYAKNITVIEPDCSKWTKMIEDNKLDRNEIQEKIEDACNRGSDVIVLGCTHYHWIQDLIEKVAKDRAVVIQPESNIIAEIQRVNLNS